MGEVLNTHWVIILPFLTYDFLMLYIFLSPLSYNKPTAHNLLLTLEPITIPDSEP